MDKKKQTDSHRSTPAFDSNPSSPSPKSQKFEPIVPYDPNDDAAHTIKLTQRGIRQLLYMTFSERGFGSKASAEILAMASEMVNQDTRMTMCPVWMVDSNAGPRFFFTATGAELYRSEALHRGIVRVCSAFDNPEMLLLMGKILIEANLQEHPQALNAYGAALLAVLE